MLAEGLGSIPSTHLQGIQGPLLNSVDNKHSSGADIHAVKTPIHVKNKTKKNKANHNTNGTAPQRILWTYLNSVHA